MNWIKSLEKLNKSFWPVFGLGLITLIGILDYSTGNTLSFSIFYLVPITLATWYTSQNMGIILSLISTVAWVWADVQAGTAGLSPTIYFWNSSIRLGFFLIVTLLLSARKEMLNHLEKSAQTDHLTGAVNTQFFYLLVQKELARTARYKRPFSLCYFDLDNFKPVNDQFGHSTGDQILQLTVAILRDQLRNTDIIARLGGDEFAVLLTEAGQEEARVIVPRLLWHLREKMRLQGWPVTFSFGVLTCRHPAASVNELLKQADDLMYSVKQRHKNGIAYGVYEETVPRETTT